METTGLMSGVDAGITPRRHDGKANENANGPHSEERGPLAKCCRCMVGATGFEPATSCSRSRRATGLRYAPPDQPLPKDLVDAPGGTRIPNLLIRSQMLYPVELRARSNDDRTDRQAGRVQTRIIEGNGGGVNRSRRRAGGVRGGCSDNSERTET